MLHAQQLGRYHLLDRIAFGGMAEIYRAKTFDNAGHSHMVAVKRVLAHLAEDDDFIQMLVDEAKIASMLRHPNVARVYEFARAQNEYFIAMEFVDGKDLRTILERGRARSTNIPIEHAVYIVAEIASALHAAHCLRDKKGRSLKLVHRDVSPSNVICSYIGEVKLCDFGIAKATLSKVQTKTGVIKGKVKYMSPEQAMGRKLDHRSDIFSLGSVLYEALTRFPPFRASNEMELLLKVRDARYRPIREQRPEVPLELESIVGKALMRSRSNRFQTAKELEQELRSFLERFSPGYTRSHLGRYLRHEFEQEIEQELRMLEEFVISGGSVDVGENLIADVLEPGAEYSKFTPIATGHERPPSVIDDDDDDEEEPTTERPPTVRPWRQDASSATTLPESRPPPSGPPPPDIHSAETQILDKNRGVPVMPTARRLRYPGSPGGLHPSELDPAIHDAPTQIIDRSSQGRSSRRKKK